MATLRNVQGGSLVGDIQPGLDKFFKAFKEKRDLKKQQEAVGTIGALGAEGQAPSSSLQLERLIKITPLIGVEAANSIRQTIESGDERRVEALGREMDDVIKRSHKIKSQPNFESKRRVMTDMLITKVSQGEDTTRIQKLLAMNEEELELELLSMETSAGVILDNVKERTKPREQFTEVLDTQGRVVGQRSSFTQEVVEDPRAVVLGQAGKASAVTKIFDNGTTVQALPNGKVVVKAPDGSIVEGDARLEILKAARKEEIEFQKTKAGAKEAGKTAIGQSEQAFNSVVKIKGAIRNIDEAIDALRDGANVGFIASKLPSIRASSIRLDNVRKKMGLGIVGITTFGALSKGELAIALDVALPVGLNEKELLEWLTAKRNAQTKLADYLQDVAIFLGTPGNTIADWVKVQKEIAGIKATGEEAGVNVAPVLPVNEEDSSTLNTELRGL